MQSFKKHLISTFGCSISVKALDKNQLILITHSAAICGTPTFEDSESVSSPTSYMNAIIEESAKHYRQDNNLSDSPFDGNDGVITLKDATVRPFGSSNTMRFAFLAVFFDQIVGVSIGTPNDIN